MGLLQKFKEIQVEIEHGGTRTVSVPKIREVIGIDGRTISTRKLTLVRAYDMGIPLHLSRRAVLRVTERTGGENYETE